MKIYAPFAGIVRFSVEEGDRVDAGTELAVVEAVKLEAPVLAPGPGIVRRGSSPADYSDVTGGDELLYLERIPVGNEDAAKNNHV